MNPLQIVYAPDIQRYTPAYGIQNVMGTTAWWPNGQHTLPGYVDVTVHFAEAKGVPKMDSGSESDPYFVATLSGGALRTCFR